MADAAGAGEYLLFLFPDPWPKDRHHDHRLFNGAFMDALHRSLKPAGCLHVASDYLPYYDEIYALLAADERFEEVTVFEPLEEERMIWELLFQEKPIGRSLVSKALKNHIFEVLRFTFSSELAMASASVRCSAEKLVVTARTFIPVFFGRVNTGGSVFDGDGIGGFDDLHCF